MEFMIGTKLLSVRNFYWYETFIGTKLLSVRNFYQYETFIGGTFIGTKLAQDTSRRLGLQAPRGEVPLPQLPQQHSSAHGGGRATPVERAPGDVRG